MNDPKKLRALAEWVLVQDGLPTTISSRRELKKDLQRIADALEAKDAEIQKAHQDVEDMAALYMKKTLDVPEPPAAVAPHPALQLA